VIGNYYEKKLFHGKMSAAVHRAMPSDRAEHCPINRSDPDGCGAAFADRGRVLRFNPRATARYYHRLLVAT